MNRNKVEKNLRQTYGPSICLVEEEDCVKVGGRLDSWSDIVDVCLSCAGKFGQKHIVNDMVYTNSIEQPMRKPAVTDHSLEGREVDVLVIGGGISGTSIARELMKWKLKVVLVDKEADLAVQASGRNDGEIHPGVDLGKGSLKQHYVLLGNRMYGKVCEELGVPFVRRGQYVGFKGVHLRPILMAYAWQRKHICGVSDTRIVGKKELEEVEPYLSKEFDFALYNPSAGCVSPYGLTVAYGENAVTNGAEVCLETVVLSMEVNQGKIISVLTNRGRIYPKIVVNAAGVFAEEVSKMAGDHFYSIHPRKGTNSITDKKAAYMVKGIASIKELGKGTGHTKGGGIIRTVHGNLLVGPNAIETEEKENYETDQSSIDEVYAKQKKTTPNLDQRDIITYFTGVRAATFEEDFVIEWGHRTKNLYHVGGIQSPGLTTAPVVAIDVAQAIADRLGQQQKVMGNADYNPNRIGIVEVAKLNKADRNKLIQKNPDYGVIVCRCEEISRGEILDALDSPIPVYTVDGVKRRVRPGMGRCQGGFCMPLVSQIISEVSGKPLSEVCKNSEASRLTYGPTKIVPSMVQGGEMNDKL